MNISGIKLIKSHRDSYLPAVRLYSKRVSISYLLPKVSRFINKFLYVLWIGATLNCYDNSFTAYSSAANKRPYKKYRTTDIFCNFGSGRFHHNKWKNYDCPGQSDYYVNLQDVKGKHYTPIDLCAAELHTLENDSSVALIYAGHTLGYLKVDSAINFLRGCYRVFKLGGVVRPALPFNTNSFDFSRYLNI